MDINRAPQIEIITSSATLENKAVESETVTVSSLFSDLNLDDTHTATVDWGDGTPAEPATVDQQRGGGLVTATHEYAFGGIYTVTVTVTDDGDLSETATVQAVITGANIVDGVLQIIGTSDRDVVTVNSVGKGESRSIRVHAGFLPRFRDFVADDVDSILIVLCDGDDLASIAGNVDIDATILGGNGDDHITGGSGNDVLVGDLGRDILLGGDGLDVLIGGAGPDRLNGQGDDDLLSGNIFDANDADDDDAITDLLNDVAALQEIGEAWRDGDRDTAVALLTAGQLDDEEEDDLKRSPGNDIYLAINPDRSPKS